jgi:hypothetical protein
MPLDATVTGQIFTSALSSLNDRSGEHRPYQLALILNARYNLNPDAYGYQSEQGLFNAVWAVVKNAANASAAGRTLQSLGTTLLNLPTIPGIGPDQPEYIYRLVAEIRLPTGERLTTAFAFRDNRPLTYQQLTNAAVQQLANSTYQWGETDGRGRLVAAMPEYPVTIHVLSAGRRAADVEE